jgi:hypothetical protein
VLQRAAERDPRVARALLDELSERVLAFIAEVAGGAVRDRQVRWSRAGAAPEFVTVIGQQGLADALGTARVVVVGGCGSSLGLASSGPGAT